MIDTQNLCTASLYINNQLVSRGLLRDGQTIDFAKTADGASDSAVTAARIIRVVNDLILRRDRDAELCESLSGAMRNLRAENLKYSNDVARLMDKNADEKRRADIAEAAQAALRTQLKSAEAAARGQKDEIAREKALVAQARSACATEVRRRDRQIDTLKKQLAEAGRSRGARPHQSITTIHVTGDVGSDKDSPAPTDSTRNSDYSLRNETNAFLAKLAQELSEENETILDIMRRTMGQLREMSGCPEEERPDTDVVKRPGCDELVAELAAVTDHMRNILTNPSFVPIEEVVAREEEICRLRSGWFKMESRWKEAVRLIDGWRRRMAASGRTVCDEELKMGLRLSPVRVNDVDETKGACEMGLPAVEEEEEAAAAAAEEIAVISPESPCPPGHDRVDLVPEPSRDDADAPAAGDEASTSFEEKVTVSKPDSDTDASSAGPRCQSSPDSSPLPEPPQLSPLQSSASAGNRGSRPRPGDFTTIVEEPTRELAKAAAEAKAAAGPGHMTAPAAQARVPGRARRARSPSHASLDDALLARPRQPAPAEGTGREARRRLASWQRGRDEEPLPPATTPRRRRAPRGRP